MTEPTIREPEDTRRDCARKLRAIQVSDHFQAIWSKLLCNGCYGLLQPKKG
jgi:hypothetical protein